MSSNLNEPAAAASTQAFGPFAPAIEYMVDSTQRNVLFWDVMRQRGNQYHEHMAKDAPHVLSYAAEIVIDGRTLERPVNYALARIIPPKGVDIDQRRRPFVVVDPRAGHGPGIAGFKADSEIGVAFKAGHPCYFVGFLPDPVPGQTLEDIARAEAVFLEKVIALHPDADAKPRDRQLPGRLGRNDARGDASRAVRPDHHRGVASVLLGRHTRQVPDALLGRPARRQLAHRAHQRSRPRQIRRRLAGAEFREPESRKYPVDQTVQLVRQHRRRGPALSRLRAVVGRACQSQR